LIPPATRPASPRRSGVTRAPENGPGRRTEDQKLARRAASGDASAFARLVREHSGFVHGVALRVLGARDLPDASQEVWIKVWRNMGSFRGESAFTTWLYRIATNTGLGFRRTRSRREKRQYNGEELPFVSCRPGTTRTRRLRP
jgi:RNA polymerase sigma-70 factor (ECF subfamily)